MRRLFHYLIVFLLGFSPAWAQTQYVQFASGTGFYINKNGDLITNAHVVKSCQSIVVRTATGDRAARLVASDRQRDLAILRTDGSSPGSAPLRWNIKDLKVGDTVYLYGFPGSAGATGKPTFVRTKLSAINGPTGQPEWLQLEAASQQGNSGGPVLDGSGNVIAVIFGRAEIYEKKQGVPNQTGKLVRTAGVAITLAELEDFLGDHMAGYYQSSSGMVNSAESIITQNAATFTYPVICTQGTITR